MYWKTLKRYNFDLKILSNCMTYVAVIKYMTIVEIELKFSKKIFKNMQKKFCKTTH